MDIKEIESIWNAWQEVQEKKKAPVTKKDDDGEGMDPVGKEDGDIDNDGDKDSSDEYLKNRRKAISKNVKEGEESPYPSLDKKKREKKGSNLEDAGGPAAKLKGESVEESEESPYPSLDKKKREKKGSNLEDAGGPAAKLKGESVEEASCDSKTRKEGEEKVDCPKCKGKGCDHCDDKGYHMKEDYEYFVENLSDEELEDYIEWLNEEDQLDELGNPKSRRFNPSGMYKKKTPSQRKKEVKNLDNLGKSVRDKETVHSDKAKKESVDRMDLYLEALRNMPNDQLDELSTKTLQSYSSKVNKSVDRLHKQGDAADKRGDHKAAARADHKVDKRLDGQDRADAKIAKRKRAAGSVSSGGMYGQKRTAAGHSYRESAYDIIDQVVESRIRSRLENLLSPHELEAIEEKAKHVGTKGPEPAPQEEFMSTSSPNDKKIYKDHEAGSDKKLEDYEDMSEKDGAKAGRAVKSQSPTRRGEKRIGDIAMPKPTKMKGQ